MLVLPLLLGLWLVLTVRAVLSRFGSTSPFYFRVRASSVLEVHGDTADKPCATGKFHEPYISVVHTLRSARAGAQQMDTLVTLKGQLGAGTSWHGKDTGRFAQGSLNAAALVLGAAPVSVESVAMLAPVDCTLLIPPALFIAMNRQLNPPTGLCRCTHALVKSTCACQLIGLFLMRQVIVEFVEGDLESQALEKIGDAAIEMEDVATSFFSDDQ